MAGHTINGQPWPNGTLATVYPADAQIAGQDTVPSGAAVTNATVSAGAVTFTGLTEGRRYVAYASGTRKFFLVQPGSVDNMRPISGIEAQEIRDDVSAAAAGVVVVQEAPLNVKDSRFGALLNGVADDWAALAAARTLAMTATKGEIYIPPGILLINSFHTYQPFDGGRLFGAGPGRSIIKVGAGGSNPIGGGGSACNRASVEHLTIDCNGQNVIAVMMSSNLGATPQSTDFSIFDVEILDSWTAGVNLTRAVRPHIKKLRINGVRPTSPGVAGVGVWLFGGTHDADLEDIDIVSTDLHGVAIDAGTNGGVIGTTADESYGNRVKGLHVKDAGGVGLLFEGGPRNIIEGAILENCGTDGPPGSASWPACSMNSDQSGLTSDDNQVHGLTILNTPGLPLRIINGSRNVIQASVNGVGRGGTNNAALFLYAYSGGTDKCEDNDIEILASDDGAGAYEWGVLLRGEVTGSVKGNKVRGSFGRGARGPTTVVSSNASAITIPFTGADANVVNSIAPRTGGTKGQLGLKVPAAPNLTTLVPTANRGYLTRVEPPERDVAMIKVALDVTVAATNNDDVAVALWDEAMTTILATSGVTSSVVNTGGWRTISLAYTLRAGTGYNLEFTYGTVGGTAATVIASNFISASLAAPFTAAFPGAEYDVKNTRHPPTAPYGSVGGAAAIVPLLVIREV